MNITLTTQETFDVLVGRIASLKVGETLQLGAGHIVRVRRRVFVLHADANKDRARWGTLSEIQDDARHFLTTGVLPAAQGGRW